MKMRSFWALLPAFWASTAAALSCVPASVQMSYTQAAEAEAAYVILRGRFDFAAADLPRRAVENDNPPDTFVQSRFTGRYFDGDSFDKRWSGPVTINARCFGPWCSHMEPGGDVLAFVERTEDGYLLSLSPCGGAIFDSPTPAQLEAVRACHSGGACETNWP